jgi:hypothetical protein
LGIAAEAAAQEATCEKTPANKAGVSLQVGTSVVCAYPKTTISIFGRKKG